MFKTLMSRARLGPFPRALHEARSFFQEPRGFDFGSITIHSEEGMDRGGICCWGTGTGAHQSSYRVKKIVFA